MFQSISVSKEVINKVRHCTCKCNIEVRSGNHYCRGKAVGITYSKCESLALVIQHAMRMRLIILLSAAGVALHYFFLIISKHYGFRKMNIEHKMVWFSLQRFSDTFLILRGNERFGKCVYWSSCEVPVDLFIL
jgi:hypothetical protein